MNQKKKIVILGGGNGGSISIRAMKSYVDHYSIFAVIGVSDSGSTSGKIRRELGVLPPGDLVRAILAMSSYDYDMLKHIFYDNRYSGPGKLHKFAIGHLFLGLAEQYNGGVIDAIRAFEQAVDALGTVFPVTLDLTDLCAELTNGEVIKGEHEIDEPNWDRAVKIARAWIDPVVDIYEEARNALREADYIILGPGSFYTSIVATLLPNGVKEAIEQSKAKLIFVAGNTIERNGETGPLSTSELVTALHTYLPRRLDMVVSNTVVLTPSQEKMYLERQWERITIDHEKLDVPVIASPFEFTGTGLDPKKLGELLHTYITTHT